MAGAAPPRRAARPRCSWAPRRWCRSATARRPARRWRPRCQPGCLPCARTSWAALAPRRPTRRPPTCRPAWCAEAGLPSARVRVCALRVCSPASALRLCHRWGSKRRFLESTYAVWWASLCTVRQHSGTAAWFPMSTTMPAGASPRPRARPRPARRRRRRAQTPARVTWEPDAPTVTRPKAGGPASAPFAADTSAADVLAGAVLVARAEDAAAGLQNCVQVRNSCAATPLPVLPAGPLRWSPPAALRCCSGAVRRSLCGVRALHVTGARRRKLSWGMWRRKAMRSSACISASCRVASWHACTAWKHRMLPCTAPHACAPTPARTRVGRRLCGRLRRLEVRGHARRRDEADQPGRTDGVCARAGCLTGAAGSGCDAGAAGSGREVGAAGRGSDARAAGGGCVAGAAGAGQLLCRHVAGASHGARDAADAARGGGLGAYSARGGCYAADAAGGRRRASAAGGGRNAAADAAANAAGGGRGAGAAGCRRARSQRHQYGLFPGRPAAGARCDAGRQWQLRLAGARRGAHPPPPYTPPPPPHWPPSCLHARRKERGASASAPAGQASV